MSEHSQDDLEVPIYSETNLAKICAVLGVTELSNEQRRKLERARLVYIFVRGTDQSTRGDPNPISVHPTPRNQRKALQRVVNAARALLFAPAHLKGTYRGRLERQLENFDLLLTELNTSKGNFDLESDEDVLKLAESAESERSRKPAKGPEPKLARLYFIRELVPIFCKITGAIPGRAVRQVKANHSEGFSYEESGRFRKFVCAALEPLNPKALQGVDRDIKKAIAELKRQSDQ